MTLLAAPLRAAPAWARYGLAALVAVGALGGAASLSVQSTVETAVAQAQRGEVRVVQLQVGQVPAGFHLSIGAQDRTRRLLWIDRAGVRRSALLATYSGGDLAEPDVLATVVAAAPPNRRPRVVPSGALLRERAASVGAGALLLLLALLAFGPQPRRLTKWGWTWLLLVLPLSAGPALLLAREAPWSRRATAEREPVDRRDSVPGVRTTGGVALVLVLAVTVLLSGLTTLLVAATPLGHPQPPGPYDVVRTDGTRGPGTLP